MPRPAVQQGAPHQLHIGILGREERGITGRIIRGDCDYCHVGNYEDMCWSDINENCFRKYGNAYIHCSSAELPSLVWCGVLV